MISHFSLPIVAVPDVTLTILEAFCTLLQVAVNDDSGCNTALPCQIFSESATIDEVEVIVVLLSLTRVESALMVADTEHISDASLTLSNIVTVTVSPATSEPDSLTLVESADTVELTLHVMDASRTL